MDNTEIRIVDYLPEYKIYFQKLNYKWIEKYFAVENEDIKLLENPEEFIIKPGGVILFAKRGEDIVGTCGLMKIDDETYELIKMAVAETEQGKKIGYLLGEAIINEAIKSGAARIILETNSKLIPAVNLYKKLGFIEIPLNNSEYKRCDLKMVLEL